MTDTSRENRLRRRANTLGIRVHKSRAGESLDSAGGFMLVDEQTNTVVAGPRYDLDLDALEQKLVDIVAR